MIHWINLDAIEQVDEIAISSLSEPIVIFKHSTSCSISAMAKMRLETSWDLSIPTYYLDLKQHRSISNYVAEKFGVHHESPQLLLINKEECILDASHFDINVGEIKEVLDSQNNY